MIESAISPPRILITAGPTQEPIDQVRFLSNRSSGRMGLAIAAAATRLGFPTTLLLGPAPLTPGESTAANVKRFRTTADLQAAIREEWPKHDVLIMAAAVADYRPACGAQPGKMSRQAGRITLELEPTPDLLAEAAAMARPGQVLIGFALASRNDLATSAMKKLVAKQVHAIVANPLETMDSETVTATLYLRGGRQLIAPAGPKEEFALWLIEQLPEIRSRAK